MLDVSPPSTWFQIPPPYGQINHNSSVKQYGSKQPALCCDDKGNFMCVTQRVHCTVTEILPTTGNSRQKENCSTSAPCANCDTARKTAHEVRRSRDTDKQVSTDTCHVTENRQILHSVWFSKNTTHLRIHTSACLKHSNFLNTDWMRKHGSSNCCSHETLLHFGLQQLRQGRVKQLPSNSNLKTGTRALNLVEHLCLLGLTNSCPTNQD